MPQTHARVGSHRPGLKTKKSVNKVNSQCSPVKKQRIFSEEDSRNIVQLLKGKQEPLKTIVIAKACGHTTTKEINPTLYELERKGVVEKCCPQPPAWRLLDHSRKSNAYNTHSRFRDKSMAESDIASILNGHLPSYQDDSLRDIDLFRKSSFDSLAPGAYNPTTDNNKDDVSNLNRSRSEDQDKPHRHRKDFIASSTFYKNKHRIQGPHKFPAADRNTSYTTGTYSDNSQDKDFHKQNVEETIRAHSLNNDAFKGGKEDYIDIDIPKTKELEVLRPVPTLPSSNSHLKLVNESPPCNQNSDQGTNNCETSEKVDFEINYNVYSDESDSGDSDSDDDSYHGDIMSRMRQMIFTQGTVIENENMLMDPSDFMWSPSMDGDFDEESGQYVGCNEGKGEMNEGDINKINYSSIEEQCDVSYQHKQLPKGGPPPSPASLIQGSALFKAGGLSNPLPKPLHIGGRGILSAEWQSQRMSRAAGTTASSFIQDDSENRKNNMPWTWQNSVKSEPTPKPVGDLLSSKTNRQDPHFSAVKLNGAIPSQVYSCKSQPMEFSASAFQENDPTKDIRFRNERESSLFYQPSTDAIPFSSNNQPVHREIDQHPSPVLKERKPALLSTPLISPFSPSATLQKPSIPVRLPLLPDPHLQPTPPPNLQINTESFAVLNKNPISALMEYAQSRKVSARIEVLSQSGPPHKPNFLIAAFLGDRKFPGVNCHNKKDGRKDAAEQAIRILIAEGQYHVAQQASVMNLPEEEMTHFDKMAALTHHKFNNLIARIPESFTGRKVIAGLVIKNGVDDVGTVIAIGSGNRCITGDQLSLEGNTVNDCHAEIITRRGFLRFLYHQLESYRPGHDHAIFEPSPSGKLRVRNAVTFHLYISTAPCGDGALFSPRDAAANSGPVLLTDAEHRPTFTTAVQGVLRTKMEGGEGTIPIDPSNTVQTWDGIVRGERLRTMSCSDKICRWNVLGMQGALLTHFLDPVYLKSLTLGFLYDHGHLSRAVCCRINRGMHRLGDELPDGYRLNHPTLGRVTACDPPRETQKTKSYSINWAYCDDRPELLDGSTGHCHTGIESQMFSRLTKRNLYDNFKRTCVHLNRGDLLESTSYHDAKQKSSGFLAAKRVTMRQFEESKCGKWVSKPVEEEMFC